MVPSPQATQAIAPKARSEIVQPSRGLLVTIFLVAHGAAVKIYRDEFKERDGGEIGITLNGNSSLPQPLSLLTI